MDLIPEHELHALYQWVDDIPLSRPKKNIARDFSDGVLVAEIVAHFFPRMIELHNYSSAHGRAQKMYNWTTLNQKVFKRLGFAVSKLDCERVINAEPGTIEQVLKALKYRIERALDLPSETPEPPGGGGYNSRQSQSERPAEPPAPAAPYVSYTPAAAQQPAPAPPCRTSVPRAASSEVADSMIRELRDTNEILETKVQKLEQLVRLKDAKIAALLSKLQL